VLKAVNKEIYMSTEDYTATLQYIEDKVAIHVTVHKWSPSTYKDMIHAWIGLEEYLLNKGYKEIYGVLPEHNEEFAYMFNWQYVGKNGVMSIFKKELGHG